MLPDARRAGISHRAGRRVVTTGDVWDGWRLDDVDVTENDVPLFGVEPPTQPCGCPIGDGHVCDPGF